jgi:serine/threonine-protein kinase HipA
VLQQTEEAAPLAKALSHVAPISPADVEARLAALPMHPLGIDGRIRVSLAGVQSKLPIARIEGGWALPTDETVSTHILKPPSRTLADTVANEGFCMALAAHAGISAAATSVMTFGSTDVLVSTRYDRTVTASGVVERLHQEDSCQALSILTKPLTRKYEAAGGPSLLRIARLLQQWGAPNATDELVRHLVLRCIVGDADWHGKNVSFLLPDGGEVSLAPAYDVMCTLAYADAGTGPVVDSTLAMRVGTARDAAEVAMRDVMEEALRWGVARQRVEGLVTETVERIRGGFPDALDTVPDVPRRVMDIVRTRLEQAAAAVGSS